MAQTTKRGLGSGLGSLIPPSFDNSLLLPEDERIQKIPVTKLQPNGSQPRRSFDEAALQELANSIAAHGILQPVVVTKAGANYEIVAGERRWRAAQLAGLSSIPVIVRSLEELERLEIAIIENVQRVDLSPLEQAASIERLHQQFGMTYESVAKRLGKGNSTVTNIVRLLQLPAAAQKALNTKIITEGHARAILALKGDAVAAGQLLDSIVKHDWSVREAERFVTAHKAGHRETAVRQRVQTETPATQALGSRLQTQVRIHRTAKGGRLEISFGSDDDLQRIIGQLS